MYNSQKYFSNAPPTPEKDRVLKKQVLPVIIYINWHHAQLAISKQKNKLCVVCQYKVLLIDYCAVIVIIVGRKQRSKH